MGEKFVTVARFSDPYLAELAKIRLDEADIRSFLTGENFVATYWLLASADGGIKLKVLAGDISEAKRVLQVQVPSGESEEGEVEAGEVVCPRCGSDLVEVEKVSRWFFFLSIFLFRFPLPWFTKRHRCVDCGHVFE